MLRWRLILGVLFTAAMAGVCWLDHDRQPRGMFLGLIALLLCVLATGEALSLMRGAGARPSSWAAYGGALVPVVAVVAHPCLDLAGEMLSASVGRAPFAVPSLEVLFLPALFVGVLLAAIAAITRFDGTPRCAIDFASTAFIALYVGGTLASLARLRLVDSFVPSDPGLFLLIATVAIVKAGDIGAYTVGRLIGRRKLAPRLSPGKTWEGALGAVVFACLTAMILLAFHSSYQNKFVEAGVMRTVSWLVFGLVLSLTGTVGDLAESLLKRSAGVKDSSTWMPGFGGVLDMLDSLLLAGPVSLGLVLLGLIGA